MAGEARHELTRENALAEFVGGKPSETFQFGCGGGQLLCKQPGEFSR
jgi:hypothetical protein